MSLLLPRGLRRLLRCIIGLAVIAAVLYFTTFVQVVEQKLFYPVEYADTIVSASERYGLDQYLVCAVIKSESNWDATTVSDAGAVGLMQIMPATAAELATRDAVDSSRYSPDNLADPATNIEYGCAYLAFLTQHLADDEEIVAAYNAGLAAVQAWASGGYSNLQDVIAYPETSAYLARVTHARSCYQALYPSGINAAPIGFGLRHDRLQAFSAALKS